MSFEVPPESSLIKKYVCRPPDSALMAPISIVTMHDATFQSIWIENGRNITQNNCLQVRRLLINEKYGIIYLHCYFLTHKYNLLYFSGEELYSNKDEIFEKSRLNSSERYNFFLMYCGALAYSIWIIISCTWVEHCLKTGP